MMKQTLVRSIFFLVLASFVACSSKEDNRSRAEKLAQERAEKNPVIKGIYHCWFISPDGDSIAPDLFILSNTMYQFGDSVGRYKFTKTDSTLVFVDGFWERKNLVGKYVPKGTPTALAQTLETVIHIRTADGQAKGNAEDHIQCVCAERE